MKLNPKLKTFWQTERQIKILYGGRMSGKTMDTAGVLVYLASRYPIRIACLRRFQNKISESVYQILKSTIQSDEYFKTQFVINETSIRGKNGSEFIFMGIQRNLEEIKGLDDISITWIEEAEKMTKDQWDIIRPTILRKERSFIVVVFNPSFDTDFIYKEFIKKSHENVLIQKINYTDNPFLSESAKSLIDQDSKNLDEDDFNHLYLGHTKKDNEDSIIKMSWLNACIDAHKILGVDDTGMIRLGFDIADSGNDTSATVLIKGVVCVEIDEWKAKEDELMNTALRAYNSAMKHGAMISYDCIGIGASAGSHFKLFNEQKQQRVKFFKFNAGDAVIDPDREYQHNIKNKDYFHNIKAQSWWFVSDRIKKTYNAITKGEAINNDEIISLSSDMPLLAQLIEQLSTPKKDMSVTFKAKVESKDDLKKRGIDSPNLADAFIMAYSPLKQNPLMASMGR